MALGDGAAAATAAGGAAARGLHDAIVDEALFPAFPLWLPASLLGNLAGTTVVPRLPEATFRRVTLAILFVAGAVTALAA